uniref:Uncharacterized protein n=1 Tax=Romanomermis culicivorax TaxID=13658 RepID=A0A915HN66_ROMCU
MASVRPQTELFLNAANDNVLEEIAKDDQPEEIEAKQPIRQAQPSPHQRPPRRLEVTELAEPIFLVTHVSIWISRHCQQWVKSAIFPTTRVTIPEVIVQPLATNSVAVELPVEPAVVNITNGHCPLLFINNKPNSIKLQPNQLIAMAKHTLEFSESYLDCQVATAAADRDLTDHEPTALDKSFPCHTPQQKMEFALNKITEKTYVTAAQKAKAPNMLQHNGDVFSLQGDKPTITSELNVEYVIGKDNACADFLSRKDDRDKTRIPNTENLTAKIFRKNFHPAGAIMAANLMVPDILTAEATPTTEVDAEINAVKRAMTKKTITPITVATATPVPFILMATMILMTPTAIITTDTAKAIATTGIINTKLDLPRTLANPAAIDKKLLYTHLQPMQRPRSKRTCNVLPPHAPTCAILCPFRLRCCVYALLSPLS